LSASLLEEGGGITIIVYSEYLWIRQF
jgi:hypothetical protein